MRHRRRKAEAVSEGVGRANHDEDIVFLAPILRVAVIVHAAHIGNATHAKEYLEAVEGFISRFD